MERANGDVAFPLSKESCLPSVRGKEREGVTPSARASLPEEQFTSATKIGPLP